jgi:curved DNA-binding protein CbpA
VNFIHQGVVVYLLLLYTYLSLMRDYYAILELPRTASQDMIREQYRFLIQAWHPDRFFNPKQKAKAEEKTKLINEAYSVLNNPKKRAQYDSVRSTQSSSFRQEQRRQQAEETKSRTEYENQQRKQAEEERQRKQAKETKSRIEYENQQRKKAEEERQRKQAKETKSRTEYENQQRKLVKEERQRKQAYMLRTALLIGLGIALLAVYLVVGLISNQPPSSEVHQTILGQNTPKPTLGLGIVSTQVLATKTFSPTPDKRLILVDPQELLLVKADLPPEAMYILPGPEWISPHHNAEVISAWGVEEGTKYVEDTGRVDGWRVIYLRTNNEVNTPEQIQDYITMYETIDGAQLAINTFYKNHGLKLGYSELDNPIRIGDISYALVYKGMQSNGKYGVEIEILFSYRNYTHMVGGLGSEDEVTIGYVENIAKILLSKLQSATLSNP